MPIISDLATNSALTAIENKKLDVSGLVEKIYYNTKIGESEKKLTDHNHNKYVTIPGFNMLTVEHFTARLKQSNLVTKADHLTQFILEKKFISKKMLHKTY